MVAEEGQEGGGHSTLPNTSYPISILVLKSLERLFSFPMTPLVGGRPQRDVRDVLSSVNTGEQGSKMQGRMGSEHKYVSSENSQAMVVPWMRAV